MKWLKVFLIALWNVVLGVGFFGSILLFVLGVFVFFQGVEKISSANAAIVRANVAADSWEPVNNELKERIKSKDESHGKEVANLWQEWTKAEAGRKGELIYSFWYPVEVEQIVSICIAPEGVSADVCSVDNFSYSERNRTVSYRSHLPYTCAQFGEVPQDIEMEQRKWSQFGTETCASVAIFRNTRWR